MRFVSLCWILLLVLGDVLGKCEIFHAVSSKKAPARACVYGWAFSDMAHNGNVIRVTAEDACFACGVIYKFKDEDLLTECCSLSPANCLKCGADGNTKCRPAIGETHMDPDKPCTAL